MDLLQEMQIHFNELQGLFNDIERAQYQTCIMMVEDIMENPAQGYPALHYLIDLMTRVSKVDIDRKNQRAIHLVSLSHVDW
jgi:hypothetical protein